MPAALLEQVTDGDEALHLADLRDKRARLTIVGRQGASRLATASKTIYVAQCARCILVRDADTSIAEGTVGAAAGRRPADSRSRSATTLVLTVILCPDRLQSQTRPARSCRPARIHCTLACSLRARAARRPRLARRRQDRRDRRRERSVRDPHPGQSCAAGRREAARGERHQFPGHGTRARRADGQGSRRPALGRRLRGHGRPVVPAHRAGRRGTSRTRCTNSAAGHMGIVLKIENAAAFRNLPHILLASLHGPRQSA
ncbi:MAG: hypothetical protein MZW92_78640 [Comamonadaceae bacterium]|nr:hypothetical protein [Comamonadaceae bacterium]